MSSNLMEIPSLNMADWGKVLKTLATGIDHRQPITPGAGGLATGNPVPATDVALSAAVTLTDAARAGGPEATFTDTEFNALLVETKVGFVLPAGIKHVRLVQSIGDTMVIRLPDRQLLLQQEHIMLSDPPPAELYGPAPFITEWFSGLTNGNGLKVDDTQRMVLNDQFVGHYAVTHCM